MAYIKTIPVAQATGDVRAMYEKAQTGLGYVPNYTKLFSYRPAVNAAWGNLLASIRSHMDPRRYELVTLAAARAMRSSYCMLAHGSLVRDKFYSAAQLVAIASDFTTAELDPAEISMMEFADKIVRDATAITEGDVQQLREQGFSDAEIFDIAATATARCFFSKLLDALGAEPDSAYLKLEEELKQQLTLGRPISQAPVEQVPEVSPTTGSI
jgi:uncharacterized peroxidase-related enzyme